MVMAMVVLVLVAALIRFTDAVTNSRWERHRPIFQPCSCRPVLVHEDVTSVTRPAYV